MEGVASLAGICRATRMTNLMYHSELIRWTRYQQTLGVLSAHFEEEPTLVLCSAVAKTLSSSYGSNQNSSPLTDLSSSLQRMLIAVQSETGYHRMPAITPSQNHTAIRVLPNIKSTSGCAPESSPYQCT